MNIQPLANDDRAGNDFLMPFKAFEIPNARGQKSPPPGEIKRDNDRLPGD